MNAPWRGQGDNHERSEAFVRAFFPLAVARSMRIGGKMRHWITDGQTMRLGEMASKEPMAWVEAEKGVRAMLKRP